MSEPERDDVSSYVVELVNPDSHHATQRIYLRHQALAHNSNAKAGSDVTTERACEKTKPSHHRPLSGRLKHLFDRVTRPRPKHPLHLNTKSDSRVVTSPKRHLTSSSTSEMHNRVAEGMGLEETASCDDVTHETVSKQGESLPLVGEASITRPTLDATTCENTTDLIARRVPIATTNTQQLQVINESLVSGGGALRGDDDVRASQMPALEIGSLRSLAALSLSRCNENRRDLNEIRNVMRDVMASGVDAIQGCTFRGSLTLTGHLVLRNVKLSVEMTSQQIHGFDLAANDIKCSNFQPSLAVDYIKEVRPFLYSVFY